MSKWLRAIPRVYISLHWRFSLWKCIHMYMERYVKAISLMRKGTKACHVGQRDGENASLNLDQWYITDDRMDEFTCIIWLFLGNRWRMNGRSIIFHITNRASIRKPSFNAIIIMNNNKKENQYARRMLFIRIHTVVVHEISSSIQQSTNTKLLNRSNLWALSTHYNLPCFPIKLLYEICVKRIIYFTEKSYWVQ